jgi:hypothetical protein
MEAAVSQARARLAVLDRVAKTIISAQGAMAQRNYFAATSWLEHGADLLSQLDAEEAEPVTEAEADVPIPPRADWP